MSYREKEVVAEFTKGNYASDCLKYNADDLLEMFDQAKKKTAKIPLKLLEELLVTMKKGCLCALCGAIPTPIQNILKYFGDEMKNDMVKDN